jgi:uncharacterized integral membrane protein
MLSLIVAVIMLTLVVLFSVQNAEPVSVSFLAWHFEASLAIVIALSLLGGMIVGMTMLSPGSVCVGPAGRKRRQAAVLKRPTSLCSTSSGRSTERDDHMLWTIFGKTIRSPI